jgi:hypothetical protein
VVVLALQECLDVGGVAASAAAALGGGWASWHSEIGSGLTFLGYHGYIGLAVRL